MLYEGIKRAAKSKGLNLLWLLVFMVIVMLSGVFWGRYVLPDVVCIFIDWLEPLYG